MTEVVTNMYNDTDTTIRMSAITLANTILRDRVFEFFQTPHSVRNAEELADLIVIWAKTGKSVVDQIAENQAKALKLQEKEPQQTDAPAATPMVYG